MSLRVLHITRTALTVDTFLRPLLAEHQTRGHHVELAFGRSSNEPLYFGVPVHRYPIDRSIRPDRFLMAVRGLKRILHQGEYDVIVAHMALVGVAARIAFALAGRPGRMVYASHGLPCYLTCGRMGRWFALSLERVLSRWNDGMIVLNSFDYRMATKYRLAGSTGQVNFLHTVGIPYNDIVQRVRGLERRTYRKGLGLDLDVPVIVYAGRFIKAKGVQVFLEIARRMVSGGVKAQFVIAGSGPLEGFVRRFIETNQMGEHIKLLGWYDDMVGLLAASDILCLPTFYEGAPVVVQEAMAAGCAVVVSDVPGPQDLIDHRTTGILVPPGDVGRFWETLNNLLTDETWREELVLNARHHAAQFDVSIWAQAWVDAIESVAQPGHENLEQRIQNSELRTQKMEC